MYNKSNNNILTSNMHILSTPYALLITILFFVLNNTLLLLIENTYFN